jgi:hypothetical protein
MLSIVTDVPEIGLAKNPIAIKLETDNYITTPGGKFSIQLNFTGNPAIGNTIQFQWGDYDYTFTVVATATPRANAGLQIYENGFGDPMDVFIQYVLADLRSLYQLDADYDIQVTYADATDATILITARETGAAYDLTVTNGLANVATAAQVLGVNEVVRDNFKANVLIYTENIFNSGLFTKLNEQLGHVDDSNQCTFEVNEELLSILEADVPAFNQAIITQCEKMYKRYYLAYAESYGIPSVMQYVANQAPTPKAVIFAGLSWEAFPGNTFIVDYTSAAARKFLTTQPRAKTITTTQQEFLYLYNKQTGGTLNLVAKVYYTDGSNTTNTILSKTPLVKQVYIFPAGYTQLGIAALDATKTVKKYEIYVSHSVQGTQSETFTYTVEHNAYRDNFYFLFQNSLGGFDTVWCNGVIAQKTAFTKEVFQNIAVADYENTGFEVAEYNQLFQQKYIVSTGHISKEYAEYLQDFYNSEHVYIVSATHFLRVNLEVKEQELPDSDSNVNSAIITAVPAHANKSYTA